MITHTTYDDNDNGNNIIVMMKILPEKTTMGHEKTGHAARRFTTLTDFDAVSSW